MFYHLFNTKDYTPYKFEIHMVDAEIDDFEDLNFDITGAVSFSGEDDFRFTALYKKGKLWDVTANDMEDNEVYIVDKYKHIKSFNSKIIEYSKNSQGRQIKYKFYGEL